ncbi:hypothetical protein GCM10010232_36170 [Streptomyces amakusaensis]|uniref:NACHT domain-containing protein n=1 Tax=Streptomyces amakusaensis TaxID=67271 RepID=A0ABW0AHU8_9ACTN
MSDYACAGATLASSDLLVGIHMSLVGVEVAQLRDADRRLLWGKAGNECAFPGCNERLIEEFLSGTSASLVETVVGEEAHIVAEADGGPRADPAMPKAERNSYPNMILLCKKHHSFVDRDNGIHFTVEQLQGFKRLHEEEIRRRRSDPDEQRAISRSQALYELLIASRARLIARWQAAGLDDVVASELADDPVVGRRPKTLVSLKPTGVVVLSGEFGSGKSVTAERLHQEDVNAAQEGDTPLPAYLHADDIHGPLQQAVESAVEPLGVPGFSGVRIVLDGLDEIDAARAQRFLNQARQMVQIWPGSRVLMTSRPGLQSSAGEEVSLPPMSYEEAKTLARRLGQQHLPFSESTAVREALLLPLFIIIAAVTREEQDWRRPRSRIDFLEALVQRALRAGGVPEDDTEDLLEELAWLAVQAGGPVAEGELGLSQSRAVRRTRLVVRQGRTLRFGLPILEQYFAGRALLERGIPEQAWVSSEAVERWRYPLALALAAAGWQQCLRLMEPLVARYPGVAAWVVDEAFPKGSGLRNEGPTLSPEAGQRAHFALARWLPALGPAADLALYQRVPAPPLVLGYQVHGTELWGVIQNTPRPGQEEQAIELPQGSDYEDVRTFAGFPTYMQFATPAFSYPGWPWQWSLTWISQHLEKILGRQLHLTGNSTWAAERRWALSRALVNQKGFFLNPLDVDEVAQAAKAHTGSVRSTFTSARNGNVVAAGSEFAALIADLESGIEVKPDGLLHAPFAVPNRPRAPGRMYISDFYSDEALLDYTCYLFESALSIYQDLCDQWFPRLRPTLRLASQLPSTLTGTVKRGGLAGTRVTYWPVSADPTAPSTTDFTLDPPPGRERVPDVNSQYTSHALPFSDAPATDLAHSWLWSDLRGVRLLSGNAPSRWQ